MWFIPLLWCEKDKRNLNTAKGVYNTTAYILRVSYQQCKCWNDTDFTITPRANAEFVEVDTSALI